MVSLTECRFFFRIPPGLDLFYLPGECIELPPLLGTLLEIKPEQDYKSIQPAQHQVEVAS